MKSNITDEYLDKAVKESLELGEPSKNLEVAFLELINEYDGGREKYKTIQIVIDNLTKYWNKYDLSKMGIPRFYFELIIRQSFKVLS